MKAGFSVIVLLGGVVVAQTHFRTGCSAGDRSEERPNRGRWIVDHVCIAGIRGSRAA